MFTPHDGFLEGNFLEHDYFLFILIFKVSYCLLTI